MTQTPTALSPGGPADELDDRAGAGADETAEADPAPSTSRRLARRVDTTARVVDAVMQILEEAGPAGLTTARVARTARVHRATVLRRWPRPERLLAEALAGVGALEVAAPNTGSLAGDLLAFITLCERSTTSHRTLLRALGAHDMGARADATEALSEYFRLREEALAEMLRRARLRGNRVHERSAPTVFAVINGAIYLQTVLRGQDLSPAEIDRLVGAALAAARPVTHPGAGATGALPISRVR